MGMALLIGIGVITSVVANLLTPSFREALKRFYDRVSARTPPMIEYQIRTLEREKKELERLADDANACIRAMIFSQARMTYRLGIAVVNFLLCMTFIFLQLLTVISPFEAWELIIVKVGIVVYFCLFAWNLSLALAGRMRVSRLTDPKREISRLSVGIERGRKKLESLKSRT
jgi:hypothetical protein